MKRTEDLADSPGYSVVQEVTFNLFIEPLRTG